MLSNLKSSASYSQYRMNCWHAETVKTLFMSSFCQSEVAKGCCLAEFSLQSNAIVENTLLTTLTLNGTIKYKPHISFLLQRRAAFIDCFRAYFHFEQTHLVNANRASSFRRTWKHHRCCNAININ